VVRFYSQLMDISCGSVQWSFVECSFGVFVLFSYVVPNPSITLFGMTGDFKALGSGY